MPALTAAERKHWEGRIGRLIDRKIVAVAAGDAGLLGRVREEARRRALRSLGLAEIQAELDEVAARRRELEVRERRARRAMLAVVRRVPVEEVGEAGPPGPQPEVTRAVRACQAAHEEELLAGDERGREILRLRREREGLADAVWLATSPAGARALWRRALGLLGAEPTALQGGARAPAGGAGA
jgi:hypothetical protein